MISSSRWSRRSSSWALSSINRRLTLDFRPSLGSPGGSGGWKRYASGLPRGEPPGHYAWPRTSRPVPLPWRRSRGFFTLSRRSERESLPSGAPCQPRSLPLRPWCFFPATPIADHCQTASMPARPRASISSSTASLEARGSRSCPFGAK